MQTDRLLTLADRIRTLRKAKGFNSDRQLMQLADVNLSTIRNISKGHQPGADTLKALAQALGETVDDLLRDLPEVEKFDVISVDSPSEILGLTSIAKRRDAFGEEDLKLFSSTADGDDGMVISRDEIERVRRPAPLVSVKDAFAIYTLHDTMSPKYKTGDTLLIHPGKPPRPGEFVIAVLNGSDGGESAIVRRLVSQSADSIVLEQLNPPRTTQLPRTALKRLYLIVGSYDAR